MFFDLKMKNFSIFFFIMVSTYVLTFFFENPDNSNYLEIYGQCGDKYFAYYYIDRLFSCTYFNFFAFLGFNFDLFKNFNIFLYSLFTYFLLKDILFNFDDIFVFFIAIFLDCREHKFSTAQVYQLHFTNFKRRLQ